MRPKHILLIYKMSTYKYFAKKGYLTKLLKIYPKHDERFRRTHIQHYLTLKKVESFLEENHLRYTKMKRGGRIDFSKFDFVVTVGGDGTFLEAARSVGKQLLLGINSDPRWSVGRFCIAHPVNFRAVFSRIFSDQMRIMQLNRLLLELKLAKQSFLVLNDLLICNENPAAMSRYFIIAKHIREEQRSSGIWISTAVGSTGAIHSAGGKILPWSSQRWQYKPRELYCGWQVKHCLPGGILKPSETLRVISLMKDGYIYVDGAHAQIPFPTGEEAKISQSLQPINFLHE